MTAQELILSATTGVNLEKVGVLVLRMGRGLFWLHAWLVLKFESREWQGVRLFGGSDLEIFV